MPRSNNIIKIHYKQKQARVRFAVPEKFLWMSYWINQWDEMRHRCLYSAYGDKIEQKNNTQLHFSLRP